MARAKCYHTMDAFVKLVVVLVRYSGDAANTVTKVNLLNKVSTGHIIGCSSIILYSKSVYFNAPMHFFTPIPIIVYT